MALRRSSIGGGVEKKSIAALSAWAEMGDPAEIEDAVIAFVPGDEPQRSAVLSALAKVPAVPPACPGRATTPTARLAQMLNVEVSDQAEDGEKIAAVVSSATLRAVQNESSHRATVSMSMAGQQRRVTIDDTLDLVKVVLVGDSGVGKTCFMLRFVKDEFVTSTRATIGMDFLTRQLGVDVLHSSESSVVQQLTVQCWDTAGQEQFHSLTATYYRKAGGVMVLYDATDRKSFESVERWLSDVDEHASEGVTKMIVSSKTEGPTLAVPPGEGEALAKKHGCLFAATSSKDNNNVVAAFRALCSKVLESQERMESIKEEAIVSLTAGKPRGAKTTGGNCC